jgi:peroxiredoxin
MQLVELQEHLADIREQGFGLAAISYDSVAILKNFSDRRSITFPLLSDYGSKIIRSFGILDETVPRDSGYYGVPHMESFLIGLGGKVINKFYEGDSGTSENHIPIVELLERPGGVIAPSHATKDAKHLRVSSSAIPDMVRWNWQVRQHVKLLLDVNLPPKTHVYSPGVQDGYIPIDWKMADSTAKFKFSAVKYPSPETFRVQILNETLPVYRGRIQLERDLTVGVEQGPKPLMNERGEITLEGTLHYQACDDHECYPPETVPLRWTFRLEVPDESRPPTELQHKVKQEDVSLKFSYDNKTKRLRFINDGRMNISIWGLVLNDGPRFDEKAGPVMAPTDGSEIAGSDVFQYMSDKTQKGSNVQYPVEIFIKAANGKEFVMHSSFVVTWENDAPVIQTQTGVITAEQWSRSTSTDK